MNFSKPEDLEFQVAKTYYDYYLSESQNSQKYQSEIAKWLLASLVLMNGGAIVLLSQAKDKVLLGNVAAYFVFGLAFAVGTGFMAWSNAGVRDRFYDEYAQPSALRDGVFETPKNSKLYVWQIYITYYGSMVSGCFSLVSFVIGALKAT